MNKLGTKAETLQRSYQKLKYAEVLPQYTFTVGEWEIDSYDDKGSTSAITSGNGTSNKLYYRFKQENCGQFLSEERGGQVLNSVSTFGDLSISISASEKRIDRLCLVLQELEGFF